MKVRGNKILFRHKQPEKTYRQQIHPIRYGKGNPSDRRRL